MPLADGQVVAGYTILRTLGAGGMSEVYLVQHPRLPRYDALKVLGAAVSKDEEYRQRFNLEADMVSTLTHPHIVTIYDRGEFDDKLWIAMEYVEGTDASGCSPSATRTACHPTTWCASSPRSPRRWITRTARACCIGTSNPPTSCSPARVR
jgi:serine/threonine protein kinase